MWRCFLSTAYRQRSKRIFSTYVEVFPDKPTSLPYRVYFLHVCGGVSLFLAISLDSNSFSPRMWRCFLARRTQKATGGIFSTYVEVFPSRLHNHRSAYYFLHVCGGVSITTLRITPQNRFSPRMWRCFCLRLVAEGAGLIFSTYVEVFLRRTALICESTDFLHVCGGVSR